MGLMRLLAVSPCFKWGQIEAQRYSLDSVNQMPRFGGGLKVRPNATLEGRQEGDSMGSGMASSEAGGWRRWFSRFAHPAARPASPEGRGAPDLTERRGPLPVVRRTSRIGVWEQVPMRRDFKPAPIQAELALDAVKVVRNDLTDADLEVIPAGVEAATQTEATLTSRPDVEGANGGEDWSRLAAPAGKREAAVC